MSRREYLLGLDSHLIRFVRQLGANVPVFSHKTVQKLNGVDSGTAAHVVRRGLDIGVFAHREGMVGHYRLVQRDLSHSSKR